MGWQGTVHRRGELERIAHHLGCSWQDLDVACWRDNDKYWVWFKADPMRAALRIFRKDLSPAPSLGAVFREEPRRFGGRLTDI